MATTTFAAALLLRRIATLGAFTAAVFFVFSLAVGYAPLVVPVQLASSIGLWYLFLLSMVAAVAVGVPGGILCRVLFPRRTVLWALAASGAVAATYLLLVLSVRAGHTDYVWWTPFADALVLVGAFTSTSYLYSKARDEDAI